MNTSFCHLLISLFVVSCNSFKYTFRGEKRGPEDFTDFGKALRASYLFLFWRKGTLSPQILMEIQQKSNNTHTSVNHTDSKKTVCIKISAWENVLFAACPQTVGT